jgi:DNA uptake protein ComE-like DNA-binding protein
MTNLNTASVEEIVAAGITPAAARAMALWGPFRSWEDLLWISEVDDGVMARLKTLGFKIEGPADHDWPAPKPFQVSSAAA